MQKKPGQISSNTLSLRFMQNAAKAQQDREVEEARAKIRTEEEWELPPELRGSWKRQGEDPTVSYEPSYLPFLFPGPSNSSKNTIPVANVKTEPDDLHWGGDDCDETTEVKYKGRRKFGKYGREVAVEETPTPAPPPHHISQSVLLPHGFRSISSHGRSAPAASSKLKSKTSHRPPQRARTPPPPPKLNVQESLPPKIRGFMKPQVDAPRESNSEHKKRPAQGASEVSSGSHTDELDSGKRKKKRRKE